MIMAESLHTNGIVGTAEMVSRFTTVKNFNSLSRTGILFARKACWLSVCCSSGTKSGHA